MESSSHHRDTTEPTALPGSFGTLLRLRGLVLIQVGGDKFNKKGEGGINSIKGGRGE